MNIDEIIDVARKVCGERYPDEPEVAKLCEEFLRWERERISIAVPTYKDHYKKKLEKKARKIMSSTE